MRQYTSSEVETIVKDEVTLSLEGLIRVGARRMLQAALEFEVEAYVENLQYEKDEQGHRQVVRNGAHRPRNLITGVAPYRSGSRVCTTNVRAKRFVQPSCRDICVVRLRSMR